MSNSKPVLTKSAMQSAGEKSGESLQSIMKEVERGQKELPDFQDMKRKYRAEKVSNNSGFKLNPENDMIMNQKIKTVDGTNGLLPCGFSQPTKAGKGS